MLRANGSQTFLRASYALLPFWFLVSLPCLAQYSGQIQGVVTDPSGAAVSGATVKVTNLALQINSSTRTDTGGNYAFASLAPGQYKVTVEMPGFATSDSNITLATAQTASLSVVLKVASATAAVEVTTTAPLLDTADARLQQTVTNQEVASLPLQGRTIFDLISFAPGVTGLGLLPGGSPGSTADNYAPETQPNVSANGRNFDGNMYVVDGLDITSNVRPGVVNQSPNPESVQEFSTQSNTFNVEYGRASSIVTQITTKSGTSQLHGSVTDYYTSQQMWARTEFTPATGYLPFHVESIFGAIGGPIVKDHTFFFASVAPTFSSAASSSSNTFEDPAFTQWAVQNFPNTLGTSLLSKYPVSGFSGRQMIETAAQVFPGTCGTAATANIPCSLPMIDSANFTFSPSRRAWQWNTRIDQYWSKDKLYGNFYRTTLKQGEPNPRPFFNSSQPENSWSVQINETHTFSSTFLNEFLFGGVKVEGVGQATGPFHIPSVSVTGVGAGLGVGWVSGDFIQHNYHWRDVLTKISGKHTFKFGGDELYTVIESKFAPVGDQPSFSFDSLLDLVQDNPHTEGGLVYNPLTGQPNAYNFGWGAREAGLFFQDQWRPRPNLSVSMGVRYDQNQNPYPLSKYPGFIQSNFFLGAGSTFQQQVANGSIRVAHNFFSTTPFAWSPRVGIAWDPTGNGTFKIRAGIGVYHDQFTTGEVGNINASNPPSFLQPTFIRGTATPPIFALGASDKYPFGYPYPPIPGGSLDSHGGLAGVQSGVGGIDSNLKMPDTYNMNIGFEKALNSHMVVSASFVGSRTTGLPVAEIATFNNFGNDVNRYNGALLASYPNVARLNPSFGSINYYWNGADSTYKALVFSVNGRFGGRGSFQASYTRSSTYGLGTYYPEETNIHQYWGPADFDTPNRVSIIGTLELPRLTGGNSALRAVAGGWQLSGTMILQSGYPFSVYTSAPFIPTWNSPNCTAVSSGCTILGMAPNSGDYNADGYNYDFPSVPATGYGSGHTRADYLNGVFPGGAAAFPQPALGTEGNELHNRFRGPGFANTDMGILKNFGLTERLKAQLRLEMFNIFNRPNFTQVDGNLADGTFGKVTGQYNPRYFQIAAKIEF
jgi:carboxypeptidase family protein/TonB-dependent receptor-like protein